MCITANGDEMVADKEARVQVELDGVICDIPFMDPPLSMPILSMRRHIHRGHSCRIRHGGGYFRNLITRKKSHFIEKDGAYFMKMKITGEAKGPQGSSDDSTPRTGFARPGVAR